MKGKLVLSLGCLIKRLYAFSHVERTSISGIQYSPMLNMPYNVKPIMFKARKSKFRPTTLKIKVILVMTVDWCVGDTKTKHMNNK